MCELPSLSVYSNAEATQSWYLSDLYAALFVFSTPQIWGGPFPDVTVGEDEEQLVAYCTTDTHGTRVLPPGALKGVQFIKTPDYVEVIGYIDQTSLNLQADDYGGEEDPHGADQRGNPLGGLVYTSAFGSNSTSNGGGNGGGGSNSPYTQAAEWSYFVGSGIFCFKVCDPNSSRDASLCQHTYDRVGCTYNCPADYASINGTFSSCEGDNQLPIGQYVSNGQTMTWRQPPESEGPIETIPYTPAIPATSQCSTYQSSSLYSGLEAYYSAHPGNSSTAAAGTTALTGVTGTDTTDTAAGSGAMSETVAAVTAAASNAVSSAVSAMKRRKIVR